MQIIPAHSAEHLFAIRELFAEYAQTLDRSECFLDFASELAELPGRYAPPEGRLLLALETRQAAGCVGLRRLTDDVCEMKRLYVRPAHRGQGLGRMLAATVIREARAAGYPRLYLDTLPCMQAAIALYTSLGFERRPRPGGCGCGDSIDMELRLR